MDKSTTILLILGLGVTAVSYWLYTKTGTPTDTGAAGTIPGMFGLGSTTIAGQQTDTGIGEQMSDWI
jgi:hypothetical protein